MLSPHANVYDHQVTMRALGQGSACHASWNAPPYVGSYYPYPYAFPPLLAVLLEPLTLVSCGDAFHIWLLGSLAVWIGIAVLLTALLWRAWTAFGPRALAVPLASAIVILSPTFIRDITYGQVFLPVLAMLLGAFWLLRNRPALAGGLMALAALIQVFPALLLVYALLAGDWKVVRGAVITGAVGLVVMAWWAPASLIATPQGILAGTTWALRYPWNDSIRRLPIIGMVLVVLVAASWIAATLLTRRGVHRPTREQGYSWTLMTSFLVTPLLQTAYLIWLLPIVVTLATPQRQHDGSQRLAWRSALVVTAAYLALTLFPSPIEYAPWIALTLLGVWAIVGASTMRPVLNQALSVFRGGGVFAERGATGAKDGQLAANVAVVPAAHDDGLADVASGR
jgi:hypothetical protein